MAIAQSKVMARGQVTVPAEVRRKLGVERGSILAWDEEGDKIVARRRGRYAFEDIHRALFGSRKPKPRTIEEMDKGIAN